MSEKRIVATAPIDQIAVDILNQVAAVEISPALDEGTLLGMVENTVGFIGRGAGVITGRMITAGRDLKVIGRPGVGMDTVDIAAATKRKIPVIYAPHACFAVAEGALSLLLALVKRIPECDAIVKEGRWKERYKFHTGDMSEHTLGIIGLGRIGSSLAKLLRPFEMTVVAFDPYITDERAEKFGVQRVSLEELLSRSDYVSLHIPLNDETRGMIDRRRIASMKRGAILINTARGGVIESHEVLADALDSGRLGAVGLDVFSSEPPDSSHRIFRNPRCLCTPHVVGVSHLSMDRNYRSMATDMVAVLHGRKPQYCINPEVFE